MISNDKVLGVFVDQSLTGSTQSDQRLCYSRFGKYHI